jgi:hypothetical protein
MMIHVTRRHHIPRKESSEKKRREKEEGKRGFRGPRGGGSTDLSCMVYVFFDRVLPPS